MKKVKTILASLMIILATAVLTACSCSGDKGGDDGPIIPVSTITINSDFAKATRDEETGYLTIRCSRNDEFDITYNLAPDNTTRTQVDWDFEGNDSVVVVRKNYFSYSQSATHTVGFRANRVGNTIIKFKPKNTDKWTQATVIVGEAEAVWPSFVAPTSLNYNPVTGKVTWNQVSQMKLHTGEIVNVTMSNGVVSGLTGYIVSYKNVTTGETYTTDYNQPINACEYQLPRGNTYEVKVMARGDDFTTKDSQYSDTFRYHQLSAVSHLANNNGKISYETPEYSEISRVYYNPNDRTKYITRTSDGVGKTEFIAGENFDKLDNYSVYVVTYPKNFSQAEVEGKKFILDQSTNTRFYPSIQSDTIDIENLIAPTIEITPVRGIIEVGGVQFGEAGSNNNPYLKSILKWDFAYRTYDNDKFQVKFAYTISINTEGNTWTKLIPSTDEFLIGNTFDLSQLNPSNSQYKITVYAFGNPTNTIASRVSELRFNVLSPMTTETSINNTTLTTSETNASVFGADLYFINLNDGSKSVYKFVDGINNGIYAEKSLTLNIASLNLPAGTYNIYGRYVGINDMTLNNYSATSAIAKINNNEVVVAEAVANSTISMSREGLLTFGKAKLSTTEYINDYKLSFTWQQGAQIETYDRLITSADNESSMSVDIFANIKNYLLEFKDGTTSDNIDEVFKDYTSNSSISFTITTLGVDDGSRIDSSPSNKVNFMRQNPVNESTIQLNFNTLSFVSTNTNTAYIVSINGSKYTTPLTNEGEVTVDLSTATVDKTTKTLLECVNAGETNTITIWALGSTARANNNEYGYVDGYAVTKVIGSSITPTEVSIDSLGNLSWELTGVTESQAFDLKFYIKDNSDWVLANNIDNPYRIETSRVENTSGEEGAEATLGKYIYNVIDLINTIGENKTIAITITHRNPSLFAGTESLKYYVVQLSSVEMTKCMNGSEPAVSFVPLKSASNIEYIISALNLADNSVIRTLSVNNVDSADVVIKSLSELEIQNIGNYSIQLSASKASSGVNTENNAFVLSSMVSTIEIIVANKEIVVNADNENIKWQALHSGATYTVEYKLPGSSTYEFIKDGASNKVFGSEELTYNVWQLFKAGENRVIVTPYVDYEQTGVVLTGSTKENIIVKLNTISSLTVEAGVLKYQLTDSLEEGKYSLNILVDDKSLTTGEYAIDYKNQLISILASAYVGSHSYSIQVVSANVISGDYSTPINATKLASVNDLIKDGEWIQFTHVEGANIYLLNFENANGDSTLKRIKFDGAKIYLEVTAEDGSSDWQEVVDNSIAKFENGKIYLKFDYTLLGTDTVEATGGIYFYSITPLNNLSGENARLNGNVSAKYKIAKLSSMVTITVNGESFELSDYQLGEDPILVPESISYQIDYSLDMSERYTKGTAWQDITWTYDSSKFNAGEEVNYKLTFANDTNQAEVNLLFSPVDGTLKIANVSEADGTISYKVADFLSATNNGNGSFTLTFKATEITSNITTTLAVEPNVAVLEYQEKKLAIKDTIIYSTINIVGADAETGENNKYAINLNSLGLSKKGNYQLTLQFIGNENEVISSKVITSELSNKLDEAKLSTIDGLLSWSAVDNASNYSIRITTLVTGSEEGEDMGTGMWLFENYTPEEIDKPNITEEKLIELNGEFTGFETGRIYNIQIMANSSNNLSSNWSEIFQVQKLQSPTNIAITSTGNTLKYTDGEGNEQTVNIGDPMLTWTDPNNVISRSDYLMYIGDGEAIRIRNTTSDNVTLTGQLLPSNIANGNYIISMRVVGNTTTGTNKMGLLTSDQSTQNPEAHYVVETTAVSFENNTFTWYSVVGAYSYKLTFYRGSFNTSDKFSTETPVYTTFTTTNSYNFSSSEFDGTGYFTVLINAICAPAKAIVSSYIALDSEGNIPVVTYSNCASLYKSSNVTKLMVKDGLLSWSLKMSDIREFLSVHSSIESDVLLAYFSITEEDKVEAQKLLLNAVVDYISQKINNGKPGDDTVDKILYNLYTFNTVVNGVQSVITPSVVDSIKLGTANRNGKQIPTYTVANPSDADVLMFKFELPQDVVADSTSKFVVKVAPAGNKINGNDTGLISSVDGKYLEDITVYKPKAPTSVNIDNTSEEGTTVRKQISNGNLYWSLVTTEDSTLTAFDYHKVYKITAINQNSEDSRINKEVNINDTIDAETGNNPNLQDNVNYYRYLKDDNLFGGVNMSTNTNYKLEISVVGTKDSTLLESNEKIYLNSNVFKYSDVMNILENHQSEVTNGLYSYTPCANMSSQTHVYVYGPFVDDNNAYIYAPDAYDRSTWKWNVRVNGTDHNIDLRADEGKTYKDAVEEWKKLISYSWNTAKSSNWINGNLRTVYHFNEQVTGEGENAATSRPTTLNLTNTNRPESTEKFGAGSYIIRKQEIGNGRGIIDTDFSDILINADNTIPAFDYEQIATKLDTATKSVVIDGISGQRENSIWLENGKFVWKKVDRANAYRVKAERILVQSDGVNVTKSVDGDYSETIISESITSNEYFQMPENSEFNRLPTSSSSYVYRITITATHLESDGTTISPNYFDGEDVTTDDYGRTPIPTSLHINEEGIISWNEDTSYSSIRGYEIKINENIGGTFELKEVSNTRYDLSKVNFGTFEFSVRSLGLNIDNNTQYLNSCYTPSITITKLANPVVKVINGTFTWGTETSGSTGEQPTKSNFRLNENSEILDEDRGTYILHSEINTFDSTYTLEQDQALFGTGTYNFGVKYQGTTGDVDDSHRQFTIASGEQTLVAEKLSSPELENVDVIDNQVAENRIRWKAVNNASGYRALVITTVSDGDNTINKIFDIIETTRMIEGNAVRSASFLIKNDNQVVTTMDSSSELTKDFFVYDETRNDVELRLTKVIETLQLSSEFGISLNVYVQPIGTLDSTELTEGDTIYISGSFSNKKNVEIPAKPTGISFESSTGTLSWKVSDETKGHNAKITMTYKVTEVTPEELDKYWKVTSDIYKDKSTSDKVTNDNARVNRFGEITNREIEYSLQANGNYIVEVADTVFLNAVDNNKLTPTKYQVTNTGIEYSFSVRVLVGEENYTGIYISDQADLTSKTDIISFTIFQAGDGSKLLPYKVSTSTMFNSIRYYPNSHFVLTDDISFRDDNGNIATWEMIDTFTGSIDGKDHLVAYLQPQEKAITQGSDINIYKALFRVNTGSISNLNLSINNSYTGSVENSTVRVAGLTVINNGTLNNVHITAINGGSINVQVRGTLYNTRVAGLAVENTGTIDNCSVELNITSLDNNSASTTKKSSYVAGISSINSGTIINSYYNGTIRGNFVGGIANESAGTISNSYSLGIAEVTDAGITSGVSGKGIQYAGIVGSMYGTSVVDSCYSRMVVKVDVITNNGLTLPLGGIVAQFITRTGVENHITVKNCYVEFSAINIGNTANLTTSAYVIAPANTRVTFKDNYYVVVTVNGAKNIVPSNSSSVATSCVTIDELASKMLTLVDSAGHNIYMRATVQDGEQENSTKISKYPLLVSNMEKDIEYITQ